MKRIFIALCALIAVGCSNAATSQDDLPPGIALNADAITARQTSDAASARANALAAQATAARQATRDALEFARQATLDASNQRATDAAIRLVFLNVTATSEAKLEEQANLSKTETARDLAQARASIATTSAQTPTAAAIQTGTRNAENNLAGTRAAERLTETRAAEDAVEDRHQRTQAEQDARAERERARELEEMRFKTEMNAAPFVSAFNLFFPYCVGVGVLAFALWNVWRVLGALVNQINATTLATQAKAVPELLIKDVYGNVIGILEPNGNGAMIYKDIRPMMPELPEPQKSDGGPPAAPPPLPLPSPGVSELDPLLLKGRIHYTSIRAFAKSILETGDWTQDTWAGKTLPRGFVLSKDTDDSYGNRIEGGYSFVLSLFTEKNLIVGRKAGASGKWNPTAPTDADGVMAILCGHLPAPPLPPAPAREMAKTNRKRTGKPILTAN